MMKFFRNKEIRRFCLFCLAFTGLFSAAGYWAGFYYMTMESSRSVLSVVFGTILLLLCLAFSLLFLAFTLRRYKKLADMSCDIDAILHGEDHLFSQNYSEGELSILNDEINKMTLRLREQSSALRQDKIYLADSIADISHQIRTPLTSMNILLSLLAEPQLPDSRRQELVREITRLCARMEWLIEALLKISRLDAGTAAFQQETVSVSGLIKKATEPLAISMDLREQSLRIHTAAGTETFTGDTAWSVEALGNILKNCMEHTPSGGIIQLTASENPLFTEIRVEDNGPGFCHEDLPHLFERFYKGKNSSSQSIGIGLALARMIVVRQNGTLKAENRQSGGARFVLRFYRDLCGK